MSDPARLWRALGRRWTLPVLRILKTGRRRFRQLYRSLGEAAHAKVLVDTLRELQAIGMVNRFRDQEEIIWYEITREGSDILTIVEQVKEDAR